MTSYSVACGIHATDNDHLKMAELRVTETQAPEFIMGLRALLGGQLEILRLHDVMQELIVTGSGGSSFQLLFEDGSVAYLFEDDICEMESFVLDRIFDKKKPGISLNLQLNGDNDLQLGFTLWVGTRLKAMKS